MNGAVCDQCEPWCRLLLAMLRHGPVRFMNLEDNAVVQCEWAHDHDGDGTAIGRGSNPFEAMSEAYRAIRH